jgi:hypothetical protein
VVLQPGPMEPGLALQYVLLQHPQECRIDGWHFSDIAALPKHDQDVLGVLEVLELDGPELACSDARVEQELERNAVAETGLGAYHLLDDARKGMPSGALPIPWGSAHTRELAVLVWLLESHVEPGIASGSLASGWHSVRDDQRYHHYRLVV